VIGRFGNPSLAQPGAATPAYSASGKRHASNLRARHSFTFLLERVPFGRNRPIDKNALKFKELGHVLIEKVGQLFRNML
jgi:hypothetical protein